MQGQKKGGFPVEGDVSHLEGAVAEEQPRRRVAGVAGEVEPRQVAPGAQTEREGHAHVPALGPASPQPQRHCKQLKREGQKNPCVFLLKHMCVV